MKTKQIFTALIGVMILVLSACKTNPKDALARKWKITDMSSPMINAEMKAAVLSENNTIEFTKDGKYVAWSKGAENDKGSYTLSEDSKTLTTTGATGGQSQVITIKELTDDKMVGDMQGKMTVTFEPSK